MEPQITALPKLYIGIDIHKRSWKVHYKKDYMLLRSIPGIGGIVACGILCELGDLGRFNSVKHLAGYVGLTPGVHQCGGTYKAMGMTMQADPVMQGYYRKHMGKDTKKIIIKVVRKLLSRTLAVIKTETPYAIGVIE